MNNNISWKGNKVLDPGRSHQVAQTNSAPVYEKQQSRGASVVPPEKPGGTVTLEFGEGPPPSTEPGYIPNYLARNIGKNVRAEFVIGNSQYIDKTGEIIEVGINYFVLDDINSHTHVMCDMYSVKFVTILQFQEAV